MALLAVGTLDHEFSLALPAPAAFARVVAEPTLLEHRWRACKLAPEIFSLARRARRVIPRWRVVEPLDLFDLSTAPLASEHVDRHRFCITLRRRLARHKIWL